MRRVPLWGFLAVSLLGGLLVTVLADSGSKWADLGTALLTGFVVSLTVFLLEELRRTDEEGKASALLRESESAEATRRREREADTTRRDLEVKRLLVQQVVVGQPSITGMDLSGYDLQSLFFTGKHLANVRFDRSILTEADFSGCTLTSVSFRNARLSNASFRRAVLVSCDFSGANLTGSTFDGAQCTEVVFVATHAEGASSEGARFERCEGPVPGDGG